MNTCVFVDGSCGRKIQMRYAEKDASGKKVITQRILRSIALWLAIGHKQIQRQLKADIKGGTISMGGLITASMP